MRTGGKARALQKLKDAGFLVPPFIVCDPSWSLEMVLSEAGRAFPNVSHFAVRSSAAGEDSRKKSFAGHFYSAIGVPLEKIADEVTKVSESYGGIAGSVIVQEFIPSQSAGVLFTEVGGEVAIVNAIEGLCFPVVGGEACDEYICSKEAALQSSVIPEEKRSAFFRDGAIVREVRSGQALTAEEIKAVIDVGNRIEAFFGHPQDIEWCFNGGSLYILQSRPITKDFATAEETYFDSANIAESYSGIVLPLTCSFASMVYETVYKDLLAMSGIPRKKIERYSDVFENLLGFFYGRMYYNMNNWYRMAEFAPGYRRNKQNFERMITSNVKQNVTTRIKPHPFFTIAYPGIILFKIAMFGYECRNFSTHVKKHLRDLRDTDFDTLDYQECISLFAAFNKNLLRRWYITVENDFFVMTYLGLLGKLLSEEELQKAITFPSKATEQVHTLAAISRSMAAVSDVWHAVEIEDAEAFKRALEPHPELQEMLENYLHTFGGRFANELKLESIGIDEDQARLLALLKAYRNYSQKNIEDLPQRRTNLTARLVLSSFKKHASRREEFRLLRSNTFAMARRLFKRMGSLLAEKGMLAHADDVFYLTMDELLSSSTLSNSMLCELVDKRRCEYASYEEITPPAHFSTRSNMPPILVGDGAASVIDSVLHGRPASPGTISGRVRIFKEFSMPSQIDFDILVTSHTDPGWTSLIALSKGLIIEHGGVLSHASIVARELGIPTVIGVSDAMRILADGQKVEVNGSTGLITLQ